MSLRDGSLPMVNSQGKAMESEYQQFRIKVKPPGYCHPADHMVEPIRPTENSDTDSSGGFPPPPYPENIMAARSGLKTYRHGGKMDDNIYELPP